MYLNINDISKQLTEFYCFSVKLIYRETGIVKSRTSQILLLLKYNITITFPRYSLFHITQLQFIQNTYA